MQSIESSHKFDFSRFFEVGIRFLCLPDIDKPIGGVKQLYRHVEHLCTLGLDASIVTQHDSFRPAWFDSSAPTESLSFASRSGRLNPFTSIIVIPETYIGVNFSSFNDIDLSSHYRVVFNQNAYYTYGDSSLIAGSDIHAFYHHHSLLAVLCVSEDSHAFISNCLGLPDCVIFRIINAIESIFSPDFPKSKSFTWMPRKNSDHVNAILTSIQNNLIPHSSGWSGSPISQMSHDDVASVLNRSSIFLSFGHPEGFGLPVAEAMAAGCWVVGYSGLGGSELFRFGASHDVPFGNWSEYLLCIKDALLRFSLHPCHTRQLISRQSLAIRTLYSHTQEKSSIEVAWKSILLKYYSKVTS